MPSMAPKIADRELGETPRLTAGPTWQLCFGIDTTYRLVVLAFRLDMKDFEAKAILLDDSVDAAIT